jgi:hypothetical protein
MKAETGNYMRLTIRKCFFIYFIAAHLCFNASLAAEHAVMPEHVKGPVEEVIALEQAIIIALENNRQVKNAVLEISKTNEQIAAARTKRYPNFFLSVLGARLLQTATFEFPKGSMVHFRG